MNEPLLSQIMVARNDDYLGDFKRRMEMALNYVCEHIVQTGWAEDYELLICDWNSPSPLRLALNLNESARRLARFLEVPPSLVAKYNLGEVNLSMGRATNVALRRSRGRFTLLSSADTIMTRLSVDKLFQLLAGRTPCPGDLENCWLGIDRYYIPWQAAERLTLAELDRYLFLHACSLRTPPPIHGITAAEAAMVISRNLINSVRGYDEDYQYWGSVDVDLGRRIAQSAPCLKAGSIGIFGYDLTVRPERDQARRAAVNRDTVKLSPVLNDADWGLGREEIIPRQAPPNSEVHNAPLPQKPYETVRFLEGAHTVPLSQDTAEIAGAWRESRFDQKELEGGTLESLFRLSGTGGRGKRPDLSFLAFERLAAQWLQDGSKDWFIGPWYEPLRQLPDFFDRAFDYTVKRVICPWTAERACSYMAVLATVARQMPRRFFYAPGRDFFLAKAAALPEPTLEISAYDHWQDETRDINAIHVAMREVAFKGYLHFLTGPLETAFPRLARIPFAGEPFQAAFLDLLYLSDIFEALPRLLTPLLSPDCALVLRGDQRQLDALAAELGGQSFTAAGAMPGLAVLVRGASPHETL